MSKHTPGPWSAIPDSGEDHEGDWYILTDDEEAIATGLSESDARLIAAAPDLLAACKAILEHLQIPLTQRMDADALNAWTAARAAIAKVEGVS